MRSLQLLLGLTLGCWEASATTIVSPSYYGCYSDPGSLKKVASDSYQSSGKCQERCVMDPIAAGKTAFSVQAMTEGVVCLCGNTFPNSEFRADNDKCGFNCTGWTPDSCGDRLGRYYSVYISGIDVKANIDEDPKPSESMSATSSTSTSSSQSSQTTTTSTSSIASASQTSSSHASGVSKAGVAAGVVVGVLIIAAVAMGAWLFLRRRRRQQVEEEYRKSAAVRGFVQKPSSDHRLDPGMAQKRDSVGSIADNQDYSRRILKVTNPDG
jgi:cell wall integrity and stress response component